IVAQNYKTAQVFTAHGIDFCCNGGIPLQQACEQQKVDLQVVIDEINWALATPETENFAAMPLDELVRHIERVHHTYVRNTLPALTTYLTKLCQVHGERHPELFEIKDLFDQSAVELTHHMAKEEEILFPYIQALAAAQKGKFPLSPPHFGHLQNPISMMEAEHETEGSRFKTIAALADNYTPPKDACQTYQVAFMVLKEFETDLHKHIHLENNILFPNALAMYESVFAQ
ncbi:MAG: iron-sulfur cluster repair di-iron protein, partial [Phaeodactylibacter sp.]|nr:iron-sulfur cluster repair di-iron protein [Phaeodactylibacter sp.]